MSAFGSSSALDQRALRAARRRLTAERRVALLDAWSALWWSRALVWGAGLAALIALGPHGHNERAYDPAGLTRPFSAVGDLLVGPATRWDSQWFLLIAKDGYVDDDRTAFFPLYPLLAHIVGIPLASPLLGGIVVSFAAFLVALYLLHRLTALELGPEYARTAVLLCAFFPMSFYFSAVYSEALFLALAVGAVYAARLGRWPLAALAALLAGTSRSAGVLLLVPLAILWFQDDERRLRDAAWLALIPLGPAIYAFYLDATTGDANAAFSAQDAWMRHFAGPFAGVWDGTTAALDGARQLLSGSRTPVYFQGAAGDPFSIAGHNLTLFAFLVLAAIATAGVLRRLPLAYGAWCVVMLALPLSYPVSTQPLMSLPRFAAVLFPGYMWLALWLQRHRAADWGLAVSARRAGGLQRAVRLLGLDRVTAPLRAVLVDAMGTLVHLRDPAPVLAQRLGIAEDDARRALRAEIAYYRAHHLEGRDDASLLDLRLRCVDALGLEGAGLDDLLGAIRFEADPAAARVLTALRAMGLRTVAVSNWDVSLPEALAGVGLAGLLDGIVASAAVGAAKPDPRPFERALELAGVRAAEAVHVGDSAREDVRRRARRRDPPAAARARARVTGRAYERLELRSLSSERNVLRGLPLRSSTARPAARAPGAPRGRAAAPPPAPAPRGHPVAGVDRAGGAHRRLRARAVRRHPHRPDRVGDRRRQRRRPARAA